LLVWCVALCSWPLTIFSDKSEEDVERRRELLENWLKIVISSPLVLQSRFLYDKLEVSETEASKLMQYGQYLRALVRCVVDFAVRIDALTG
jgi:hypothetical protein